MKIICLLAFVLCTSFAVRAQETKSDINSLKWISGCWEAAGNNRLVNEQWMKPAGNSMIGMARTVKNGKTTEWEFLRIVQDDTGISYIAKPSGQEEAAFKLVKQGENEVIFENPTHDFPQRIIYRLKDDLMMARIEGKNKGKDVGIDFPMKRVNCQ